MGKYWAYFRLSLLSELEWRVELVIRIIARLVPVIGFYYLWRSLYLDGAVYGNYDFSRLSSYFLIASVLNLIIPSFMVVETMADEVRTGFLSTKLIKPVNYKIFQLSSFLGERSIRLLVAVLIVCLFIVLLGKNLAYPAGILGWLLFLTSGILAVTLSYWVFFSFGVGTFWLTRPLGLAFSLEVVTAFAGGSYVPLDLLPIWAQRLVSALPFKYVYYFPTQIFLGKLSLVEVAIGMGWQVAWIVAAMFLARFTWKIGLSRYEAVGA